MTDAARPHRPRKRFGQHFLHDTTVIDRLLLHINPTPADTLVEVGPGPGVLTLPLLAAAGSLTVVEIDRDLAAALRARNLKGLELLEVDALKLDWPTLYPDQSLRLVGNLPYNIGTPLLLAWLPLHSRIIDIHVMLQKEVVQRLAAAPGSKAWGRLGVMMQAVFEVRSLFDVPPGAFRPPPKVDSAIARLVPHGRAPDTATLAALESATRLAFQARRKTLRNNFRKVLGDDDLKSIEIDPAARAETLDTDAYLRLAGLLATRNTDHGL